MTWQIAIGIAIVLSVTTSLVQRQYAQRSTAPATFPSAFSYVFGVLPVGYVAGFLVFPHHVSWSWWLVLLLVIGGGAMAISGMTGFAAARRLAIAPRQTIGSITSVIVVVLGWTILHEGLTHYQLLGAILLLAAALIAIWTPVKHADAAQKQIHLVSVTLTLIAAITAAIGLTTEKAILGHMDIGGGFLVGWTAQAVAMTILALKDARMHNLRRFRSYEMKWSALMGMVNGLTGVFYIYAIVHSDNISVVTALTAVTLPLTIFGAYLFLKEREKRTLMWLSLSVSFAGLLVSALR